MGVADIIKWARGASTPALILGAITLATLFVHNREQLAVARAGLKHYTDSITVALQGDSIASARRDSISGALVARLLASKSAAERSARAAGDSARLASAELDAAKTVVDSFGAYSRLVQRQYVQVLSLQTALAAADSVHAADQATILGLRGDLAGLRAANGALIGRLNASAHVSLLNSTPFRMIEGGLAAYGAISALRGR